MYSSNPYLSSTPANENLRRPSYNRASQRYSGKTLIEIGVCGRTTATMAYVLNVLQARRAVTGSTRTNICTPRRNVRTRGLAIVQPPDAKHKILDLLRSSGGNQVIFGTLLGFATGYTMKRVGQLLLVFIGLEVIALQLMSNSGWVIVNWPVISRDLSPHVENSAVERVLEAVKIRGHLAGSFTAGCYAGLKWI